MTRGMLSNKTGIRTALEHLAEGLGGDFDGLGLEAACWALNSLEERTALPVVEGTNLSHFSIGCIDVCRELTFSILMLRGSRLRRLLDGTGLGVFEGEVCSCLEVVVGERLLVELEDVVHAALCSRQ